MEADDIGKGKGGRDAMGTFRDSQRDTMRRGYSSPRRWEVGSKTPQPLAMSTWLFLAPVRPLPPAPRRHGRVACWEVQKSVARVTWRFHARQTCQRASTLRRSPPNAILASSRSCRAGAASAGCGCARLRSCTCPGWATRAINLTYPQHL